MDVFFGLLQLIAAGFSGGLTVKLIDIGYSEYRSQTIAGTEAKRFVDSHLTPLLKSSDELMGKLRALAVDDLRPLYADRESERQKDWLSTLYLIAKFWAFIEIFREAGLTIDFVTDDRGRRLQTFIECLESRPVRLADRISQRAIGELMLERRANQLEPISFLEFVDRIESENGRRWIEPLSKQRYRACTRGHHCPTALVVAHIR